MWTLLSDYSTINGEVINKNIIKYLHIWNKNKLLNNSRVIEEIVIIVKNV